MITRLVKMKFQKSHCADFEKMFASVKLKILAFDGCEKLHLYRDESCKSTYVTISCWQSADDLEKYRNSDLFKKTWSNTKKWFSEKAQAMTLTEKL